METEKLKKLKSTVEKCIEELSVKPDLTPAETKALLDGMKLRRLLCEEIDDCEMMEEMTRDMERSRYAERSGHGYSRRSYSDESQRGYYDGDGYSGQRRNAQGQFSVNGQHGSYNGPNYGVQGWYESANASGSNSGSDSDSSYRDGYSDRRYSRHSIGDRMVAMMEKEMDQAESDYEREQIHKFIRMIRAAADE